MWSDTSNIVFKMLSCLNLLTQKYLYFLTRGPFADRTAGTPANTVDWFSARERETATVAEKLASTQTAEWHITTHQTKWYITTHCVCHISPHQLTVSYYHTPTKPIARCTLNTKNCTLQPFHCAYYCTSHISFCTKYTSYNAHRVIFTSNSNTACCRLQPAH